MAFDDFYAREYGPLLRIAYVLTGSRAVAEELVQDAMVKALRHWNRVRRYDKPGAWARRVLVNGATDRHRRVSAETRALVRVRRDRRAEPAPSADNTELWNEVRALPKREAQAIALHYLEDMSIDDIAAVLDMPEGTVKTLLHRGRRMLAEKLGEEEQ